MRDRWKENQLKTTAFAVAAVLLVAVPPLAQAPYGGAAPGNLSVDGKAVAMKYAYVVDADNAEEAGLLMARAGKSATIVLSARPLPRASVSDRYSPYSEKPSYSQVTMRLVREKGDWKLCWP